MQRFRTSVQGAFFLGKMPLGSNDLRYGNCETAVTLLQFLSDEAGMKSPMMSDVNSLALLSSGKALTLRLCLPACLGLVFLVLFLL
jgi:hypothetical protein